MQESNDNVSLIEPPGRSVLPHVPAAIQEAGAAASFAWDEFFCGQIRNRHTRTAYERAVKRFLTWSRSREPALARITPGLVGRYFDELALSIPSKKLHLAAIRTFFDVLVQRHVVVLNPARSVRTERYSVTEGRTPAISIEQSRKLLSSIERKAPIDFRDLTIIAMLIYTAVRESAIAALRLCDLEYDGTQYVLRFFEKGGKDRTIPVRHDLQGYLQQYLLVASLTEAPKDSPLFRTVFGRTGRLTNRVISGVDICRMMKRRLRQAGLPDCFSPHSFRSCTATDLLMQGTPLEEVQFLLGHADPRTTRLYDRRQKQVTRKTVERISV
jgi:site-specific recombinase XerD